jgi:hypothetical protein
MILSKILPLFLQSLKNLSGQDQKVVHLCKAMLFAKIQYWKKMRLKISLPIGMVW